MTIDSIAAPKTGRITGTLHRRRTEEPVPLRDEDLPRGETQKREAAGREGDSVQENHKSAC